MCGIAGLVGQSASHDRAGAMAEALFHRGPDKRGVCVEAISRLFEGMGLDVMEIRAINGHNTLQVLARYNHPWIDHLADRLARMGGDTSY